MMTMNDIPRCISCKHWEGDIVRAAALIEEWGLRAIEPGSQMVPDAKCGMILYDGVEVESKYGDSMPALLLETAPWFGCIHHETRLEPTYDTPKERQPAAGEKHPDDNG